MKEKIRYGVMVGVLVVLFYWLATAVSAAGAGSEITEVKVDKLTGQVRVAVAMSEPAEYQVRRYLDPTRLAVIIPDMVVRHKTIPVNVGVVKQVRVGQLETGACAAQVVVYLNEPPASYKVSSASDGRVIVIEIGEVGISGEYVDVKSAELEGQNPTASAVKAGEELLSISFKDTDIADVLRMLADKGGVNIVTDTEVKGKITIYLARVTAEQALQLILEANDLAYERMGNSMLVTTRQKLSKEEIKPSAAEMVTEVIKLNYADVTQVKDMLKGLVTVEQNLQASKWGSALIITDTVDNIEKIKAVLQKIDVPLPPVPKLEAPVKAMETYKLKYANADAVKTLLGKVFSEMELKVEGDKELNILALAGDKSAVEGAKKLIRDELDVAPAQVMIEALVADISTTAEKELGLKWTPPGLEWTEEAAPPALEFGVFERAGMTISAAMSALEKAGKAKILARPKVSTIDGKQAKITIGERIPYEVSQIVAGAVVRSVQIEEVGVRLTITPRVNDEQFITTEVKPEVSTFLEFTPAGYPRIGTRDAHSTLRVKDGETIVIGGLLREEELRSIQKVPILGDIPLFSELFRWRRTSKLQSELRIFVTPHILPPAGSG